MHNEYRDFCISVIFCFACCIHPVSSSYFRNLSPFLFALHKPVTSYLIWSTSSISLSRSSSVRRVAALYVHTFRVAVLHLFPSVLQLPLQFYRTVILRWSLWSRVLLCLLFHLGLSSTAFSFVFCHLLAGYQSTPDALAKRVVSVFFSFEVHNCSKLFLLDYLSCSRGIGY